MNVVTGSDYSVQLQHAKATTTTTSTTPTTSTATSTTTTSTSTTSTSTTTTTTTQPSIARAAQSSGPGPALLRPEGVSFFLSARRARRGPLRLHDQAPGARPGSPLRTGSSAVKGLAYLT